MELVVDDFRDGYVELVRAVRRLGKRAAPRGEKTVEVLGATVVLTDPTDALPVGVGRNINTAIAAAEALQLIGGVSDPALMVKIAPNFKRYLASGAFDGAYGPRLRGQLPLAIERLRADPDTRQAVVTVWDPGYDLLRTDSRDYPCTVSLQFTLRDGALNLHVHMRSNDVYLGAPHDFFQFTQLQLAVANVLGAEPGAYYHHAASLHAYDRDSDALDSLHEFTAPVTHRHLGLRAATVQQVQARARLVLEHAGSYSDSQERWLSDALARYR